MEAVRIENLTHLYSPNTPFQKTAIDSMNLSIEQGAFVGIIGHTGSGKSTLIQHLNGLLKPTSGKVFINGVDIWEKPKEIRKVRFQVGLVFQYPEYQLFEETVAKDIAFGPKNMGLSQQEIDARVLEAAAFVGLQDNVLGKSPFELSGGQKRRVAIAGVLAMRPSVLILDEPTAGLDPMGREQILGQIREYHNRTGSTIILVSHSMEDIARFAKRVVVINNSKIFAEGSVRDIFSHAQRLLEIGLSVPQITKVFLELKAMGYDVNTQIYTVEEAKKELLSALKKAGEKSC